jgi:hypothetical protein
MVDRQLWSQETTAIMERRKFQKGSPESYVGNQSSSQPLWLSWSHLASSILPCTEKIKNIFCSSVRYSIPSRDIFCLDLFCCVCFFF